MELLVNGQRTYCYTGGQVFNPAKPTVAMIHGVLNDHSVWAMQSRWFAHHGWNVLAIDLPGHCRSAGAAPQSVEEAAEFVIALLDALGIQRAALVGHSWGSLIALETAARLGERATHLALVGTAWPMKVSPALLESALNEPEKALRMVNVFSRSTLCAPPSALGPGTWVFGAQMALGRHVLRSNPKVNLFHRGFLACDRYAGGEAAIGRVACPVLFALGTQDQMTPPKAAQTLVSAARAAGKAVSVAMLSVGHNEMTEAPEETLMALRNFLSA
ncbi:alpha/beta fold hydrolase [Simplicispira suum]|uniref:Alpha/beta hydrolase n=1 Tax=Simplicispira suum TaxID=2109915 RepID=A0A2S0MW24_9BURK|nr:alpha/beta hydrolase [Simplicispira suum]AVO40085.1 alpha/beta hydrolase [Simplicispira suum]